MLDIIVTYATSLTSLGKIYFLISSKRKMSNLIIVHVLILGKVRKPFRIRKVLDVFLVKQIASRPIILNKSIIKHLQGIRR